MDLLTIFTTFKFYCTIMHIVDRLLPRVVNIRRRRGVPWQSFDCYIPGRAVKRGGWNLEASIWANPFKVEPGRSPGSALSAYEQHVQSNPAIMHQNLLIGDGKDTWLWQSKHDKTITM